MTLPSFYCGASFIRQPAPWLVLGAWAVLGSGPVAAQYANEVPGAEEGFTVHLGQSIRWDDNLFRLPDGEKPADGGPRSTRISQTRLGLRFSHDYSRQHVAASVAVVDRSYSDHSEQNATTLDGLLGWKWVVGNQWSGRLGLVQKEAPRSFADTLLRRERSINTLRQAAAEAEYLWHPSWSGLVGVTQTWSRYSDSPSKSSEYDETAVEAGLGFRPASGNRLDLLARYADGDYPNRNPAAQTASGYDQRELRLRALWQASGHSRFSGYLGYTRRTYSGQDRLNFSGPTGRLVYDWEPTGKLALRTTLRRELGSEDEVVDNFVLTKAAAFEPRWLVSSKVTAWGKLEWLKRDLAPTNASTGEAPRTRSYGLGLTYQPRPRIELTTAYQHSQRTASDPQLEYEDELVRIDFRLEF